MKKVWLRNGHKPLQRGLGLLLLLCLPVICLAQYTDKDIVAYIDRYKDLAIKKMYEYKIPASITLAQGIFESACGTSRLATYGNNHFGIKCHKDWTGDTLKVDDDELQECFRKYENAEDSYSDHSLFLTTRQRYAKLFELDIMDYKAWARGLKAAGYATNPQYADRLIGLIERFNIAHQDTVYLQRLQSGYFTNPQPEAEPVVLKVENIQPTTIYTTKVTQEPKEQKPDKPAKPVKPAKPTNSNHIANINTTEVKTTESSQPLTYTPRTPSTQKPPVTPTTEPATTSASLYFSAIKTDFPKEEYPFSSRQVYVNNKTLFVIAQKGDTYAKIAEDVQSTEKNIRKYNDMGKYGEPREREVIYIEHKSKKGAEKEHVVKKGETLRYIARKYAVQLSVIYSYNQLNEKSIIHPGDVIKLQ